jgi:hypothetical protein
MNIGLKINKAPLIFVWLGDSMPKWGLISLRINLLTSGVDIYLICTYKLNINIPGIKRINIEDFYQTDNNLKCNNLLRQNTKFRDGFWIKTSERFFILSKYWKIAKMPFFHAEIDNMVFNISRLPCRLEQYGCGVYVPRDSINRGIGSLIYVNSDSLDEFCEDVLSNVKHCSNDMIILGELLINSTNFKSLPTETIFSTKKLWTNLDYKLTGGIFDAASIGQYLFGIDPRNKRLPLSNGFINENCIIDMRKLAFQIDLESGILDIHDKASNCKVNLYNLHVHSKRFDIFQDIDYVNYILLRINSQKSTMLIKPSFNKIFRYLSLK